MKLLDLEITGVNYEQILADVENAIAGNKKLSISYVNAYIVTESKKNADLKNNLQQLDDLFIDGIGVYSALKILNKKNDALRRINATDLNSKILELCIKKKYKVFFLGGGDEAKLRLAEIIKIKYSDLSLAGIYSRNEIEIVNLNQIINSASPDIIFVGLGTPLQEEWICKNYNLVNTKVFIGVGSWFEFISGVYLRAPIFIRKIGLEWTIRLLQEPSRLWKRYILGIPKFISIISKQLIVNRWVK